MYPRMALQLNTNPRSHEFYTKFSSGPRPVCARTPLRQCHSPPSPLFYPPPSRGPLDDLNSSAEASAPLGLRRNRSLGQRGSAQPSAARGSESSNRPARRTARRHWCVPPIGSVSCKGGVSGDRRDAPYDLTALDFGWQSKKSMDRAVQS